MSKLTVKRFYGHEARPHLKDVARLRINVFSEYPYLYEGDMGYEEKYLSTYSDSPESLIVLAFDGLRIVGGSTGIPMTDETDEFKAPFLAAGMDPERIFYFGESVLDKAYRGRGLGVRFFVEREGYARELGRFDWCAFCAVDRPADHPLRPPGYIDLDSFWAKRGYENHPELKTSYAWKELGETQESTKSMTFRLKRLREDNRLA